MAHVPPGITRKNVFLMPIENDEIAFFDDKEAIRRMREDENIKLEPIPRPHDDDVFLATTVLKTRGIIKNAAGDDQEVFIPQEIIYYFKDFNGEIIEFEKDGKFIPYHLMIAHLTIPRHFRHIPIPIKFIVDSSSGEVTDIDDLEIKPTTNSNIGNFINGPLTNKIENNNNYKGLFAFNIIPSEVVKKSSNSVYNDNLGIDHNPPPNGDGEGGDFGCDIFGYNSFINSGGSSIVTYNLNQMVFCHWDKLTLGRDFYIPTLHDTGKVIYLKTNRIISLKKIFKDVYIHHVMKIGFKSPIRYNFEWGIYFVDVDIIDENGKNAPDGKPCGGVDFKAIETFNEQKKNN